MLSRLCSSSFYEIGLENLSCTQNSSSLETLCEDRSTSYVKKLSSTRSNPHNLPKSLLLLTLSSLVNLSDGTVIKALLYLPYTTTSTLLSKICIFNVLESRIPFLDTHTELLNITGDHKINREASINLTIKNGTSISFSELYERAGKLTKEVINKLDHRINELLTSENLTSSTLNKIYKINESGGFDLELCPNVTNYLTEKHCTHSINYLSFYDWSRYIAIPLCKLIKLLRHAGHDTIAEVEKNGRTFNNVERTISKIEALRKNELFMSTLLKMYNDNNYQKSLLLPIKDCPEIDIITNEHCHGNDQRLEIVYTDVDNAAENNMKEWNFEEYIMYAGTIALALIIAKVIMKCIKHRRRNNAP